MKRRKKPNQDDQYFVVRAETQYDKSYPYVFIDEYSWENDKIDKRNWRENNVFNTKKEAQKKFKKAKKIVDKLKEVLKEK